MSKTHAQMAELILWRLENLREQPSRGDMVEWTVERTSDEIRQIFGSPELIQKIDEVAPGLFPAPSERQSLEGFDHACRIALERYRREEAMQKTSETAFLPAGRQACGPDRTMIVNASSVPSEGRIPAEEAFSEPPETEEIPVYRPSWKEWFLGWFRRR